MMAESFDALLKRRMAEHAERDLANRRGLPDGAKAAADLQTAHRRKRDSEWREKNPEKVKENFRRYYEANKSKILANCKEWQKAHPEAKRLQDRRWREKNPERVKANSLAWKMANPEKVKATSHRYYEANKEKILANSRAWMKAHPGMDAKYARNRRDRFIAENKACPFCGAPTEVVLVGPKKWERVVCTGCKAYASTGRKAAGWKIHKKDKENQE